MRFGDFDMKPAHNPAVLDTATWDRPAAWQEVSRAASEWQKVLDASRDGRDLPEAGTAHPYSGSRVTLGEGVIVLCGLSDGQQVFVEIGTAGAAGVLGQPIGKGILASGEAFAAYPTDASVVNNFCLSLKPDKGPRALRDTPRLGIGCRMTTAVWPGMFSAMQRRRFAANTIQNSVRELNLLDDMLACRPAPTNYACGFGTIETGYTGSTFEGLWLSGVLTALQSDGQVNYGADADHIQVKRGPTGLDGAKRVIDAARYYTFYTLDMSDVLRYDALADQDAVAETHLSSNIPNDKGRRDVLAWHCAEHRYGNRTYALSPGSVGRFVGKYWAALDALADLHNHIVGLKNGQPFDLEMSIDEHPAEVGAFDCLTTAEEVLFVLSETRRRGIPITHIAPNFGMEKGWDYRGPDGLDGLERRVRAQFEIAEEFGVMLDSHSADDLTAAPRRVFHKATGGKLHYKVSPMLQIIFAEVLREFYPKLFMAWWDDAMAYATREAEAGSQFAKDCLAAYGSAGDKIPSRDHAVFHHFSFAFVGRRDASGRFLYRDEFYSLSPAFYEAYQERIAGWLCGLAEELF